MEPMTESQAPFSSQDVYANFHKDVLDHLYDGVYYVNQSRQVTFWNKSAEKITGYTKKELIGRPCSDNLLRHINDRGDELCLTGCPLGRTLEDGETRDASVYLHHKDGHRVPVSVRVSPVYDNHKNIIGAVEIFSDNSKNINMIKELEVLRNETYTDMLTQVGNRNFAEYEITRRLRELKDRQIHFGILFFDIDNFKTVNDTYGHNIGDSALKLVSKTVYNIIRSLDSLCRWGGDEFIVVLPNVDQNKLGIVAEKIRVFVEKTWLKSGDETIRLTLSIGAAMAERGESKKDLIERADQFMYQSKQQGRNRVSIG